MGANHSAWCGIQLWWQPIGGCLTTTTAAWGRLVFLSWWHGATCGVAVRRAGSAHAVWWWRLRLSTHTRAINIRANESSCKHHIHAGSAALLIAYATIVMRTQ